MEENEQPPLKLKLKVFGFGFMIDIMYVLWIWAVGSGNVLLSGFASVGLAIPGLLGYLEILENRKLIKPYLIGLFCGSIIGTYLAHL